MKIKIWFDIKGVANSLKSGVVDLNEYDLTAEEWAEMDTDMKEAFCEAWAVNYGGLEIGWTEEGEG